jgi:hypothetical protein
VGRAEHAAQGRVVDRLTGELGADVAATVNGVVQVE